MTMWQSAPCNDANWGNHIWAPRPNVEMQETYHQARRSSGGFPGCRRSRQQFGHASHGNSIKHNFKQKSAEFVSYCDVCDRGFKTDIQRQEHFKQHTKCSEAGCKFEAHFKVVAIHKKNVHGTRRLNIQLETPEEIRAWREERKRRYPTAQNVDLKTRQSKEQHEAGNVLKTKTFGKMRKFDKRTNAKQEGGLCLNDPAVSCQQNVETTSRNLLESASVCFDNQNSDANEESSLPLKVNITSALGSLMGAYESDSEEETKTATVPPATENPNSPPESTCRRKSGLPWRGVPKAMNVSAVQHKSMTKHRKKNGRKPEQRACKVSGHRKNLLEMLLASDIRKERNIVLQCVRYIVENNFFDDAVG